MRMLYLTKWLSLIVFTLMVLSGCQSTTDTQINSTKTLKVVNLNEDALIPINSTLTMEFSADMDINTLSSKSVYLLDSMGDMVDVTLLFVDTTHLNIEPQIFLKPLEKYKLIITTDIKSITGLALLEQYELNFIAGYSTDLAPPKLLGFLPNYEYGVDKFTTVALQFDEQLAIDNQNNIKLTYSDESNKSVEVEGKRIEVGSSLRFIPAGPLVVGTKYILSLTGDVMDKSRNIYTGEKNWAFVADGAVEYDGGVDNLKSHIDLNANVNSIHTYNNLIYVCATNRVFVVEVGGDKKLKVKSDIAIDGDVYDIALSGDFIALATDKGITIMKGESVIQSFTTKAPVYGITYKDRYFYGAGSSEGLYIFSADNGIPTQEDFIPIAIDGTAFDVASDGEYLYVAQYTAGVSKYDLNGNFIENYPTKTATRSIELYNNTLYVSSGVLGVSVINLADANISSLPTLAFAMNSVVYKNNLYVADKEREVAVFDIATNSRIAHIKNFDTPPNQDSNKDDIYGVTFADDMLITMSKRGTLTTYSPVVYTPPIPLQVTEVNSSVVDMYNMDIFLKFNKDINSSYLAKENINLVRRDNLGCFTHTFAYMNFTSPTSATLRYIADNVDGVDCEKAMTLDFNLSIKDMSGVQITAPNTSVHLRIEDNIPPSVLDTTPKDRDSFVSMYNAEVSVTFSEDINISSITNQSVGLYGIDVYSTSCAEYSIGTNVSYDENTKTATIDYPAPIIGYTNTSGCDGTVFKIRVEGVKDLAGNIISPSSHTFTIGGAI